MNTENQNYRILVADDEDDVREVTTMILERAGYKTVSAINGKKALEEVYRQGFDLILLDYEMPHLNGFEVTRRIRSDFLVRHIPIMILTGTKRGLKDKVEGLGLGSDDYILKPFEPEEFLARVQAVLQRSARGMDANPLTRLPGNTEIIRQVENCISQSKIFCVLYMDINNFKAFNDRYGFLQGDNAIRLLSTVMATTLKTKGNLDDFLGHVGGDDFVIITTPEMSETLAKSIMDEFSQKNVFLYDETDQKNGHITVRNRKREIQKYPLMTLTVVGVSNKTRKVTHFGELSSILGELKCYAKTLGGNQFILERRTSAEGN